MPVLPAPDHEYFDVASNEQAAREEYKRCKRIWTTAFKRAQPQAADIELQILIMREYYRAAEQVRHRYQSHYKRPIDKYDTLTQWPEPTYTPEGQVMPVFETADEIHARLYAYLRKHYPHLTDHWPT